MKSIVEKIARLIGTSFYLIEFLLIFFPFYYYFLLFLYLLIFIFDEGLINLLKWEENRYAIITTQAFDSILHLYYYIFYLISIMVSIIYILMAGLGDYLVSKIRKNSNEVIEDNIIKENRKKSIEIQNYTKGRKRKALLNVIKYGFTMYGLIIFNIHGNFFIREHLPHTLVLEIYFLILAFLFTKFIYLHAYTYKNHKPSNPEIYVGLPISYGIMKSIFWGYILLFEIV